MSATEIVGLAPRAEREGTSPAEVIRRPIRLYEPARNGDRRFSFVGSADGPGGSVAEVAEAELRNVSADDTRSRFRATGRLGRGTRLAFLNDLAPGRLSVACLEADVCRGVADFEPRHHNFDVGLADRSVAAFAERFDTRRILNFEESHFRALRPVSGGQLTLLPSDAPTR